jgi:predicted Fe-Mo cluster-binding NifX family protein
VAKQPTPYLSWEIVLKIAVSANGANLTARVGPRFGISPYLVIVNPHSMNVEAVPNPGAAGQRAAGFQALVMVISKKVDAVMTGYCSPTVKKYLSDHGIEVITGVTGTVAEAVMQYCKQDHPTEMRRKGNSESTAVSMRHALKSSGQQLINLLPLFVGVILLVGLFNAFISKKLLSSIFSGNTILDILSGASFGSILAGNPINSYVIGGELIEHGVSLFAVTAFISAWVTVGLVQLPAEMAALGKRFALTRNVLSFVLSMAISIFTVVTYNFILECAQ